MPQPSGFKGNKQHLPQKPCAACGRAMVWRKSWAKNWESVLYCSDRCRADKANARPAFAHVQPSEPRRGARA